jgi:hypothetical protein
VKRVLGKQTFIVIHKAYIASLDLQSVCIAKYDSASYQSVTLGEPGMSELWTVTEVQERYLSCLGM